MFLKLFGQARTIFIHRKIKQIGGVREKKKNIQRKLEKFKREGYDVSEIEKLL